MPLAKPYPTVMLLAGLAAGCAELPVPEPVLEEVCQAANPVECRPHALAGSETELLLLGTNFNPGFDVDLDNHGTPGLDSFSARVGGVAIEQLALAPGRVEEREVLAGWLPGSLELGIYDVELETPGGQRARLAEAFRITSPLEVVAVLEAVRIPAGHTIGLSVSFENLGSRLLNPVEFDLSQEGAGSLSLPAAPPAFEIEAQSVHKVDMELRGVLPGNSTVLFEVQASTEGGLSIGPSGPVRVDLVILREAALSVRASISPGIVSPGQTFELQIEVSCLGETPALEVGLASPQLSGSGSAELDPPPSQLVDIPPESTRSFHWTGSAVDPGVVQLTLVAVGREAISGRQLGPALSDPIVLEIQ